MKILYKEEGGFIPRKVEKEIDVDKLDEADKRDLLDLQAYFKENLILQVPSNACDAIQYEIQIVRESMTVRLNFSEASEGVNDLLIDFADLLMEIARKSN